MKTKNLALTNGVVGLVGGIILLFGIIMGGAAAGADEAGASGSFIFLEIIKITILVLGIVGAVYYRSTDKVTTAPSVLLIVGGAISLIPLLGWVGGIIDIIGGSLYLAQLKNFKEVK